MEMNLVFISTCCLSVNFCIFLENKTVTSTLQTTLKSAIEGTSKLWIVKEILSVYVCPGLGLINPCYGKIRISQVQFRGTTYQKGGIFHCLRDQSNFGAFIQISKKKCIALALSFRNALHYCLTLLRIFLRLSAL